MVPLNDFIDSNKSSLRNFLEEVLNRAKQEEKVEDAVKSLTTRMSATNLVVKKDEKEKGVKKDEELLEPLEVPRYAVESSLCFLYNQFYKTKDRVFSALEKYCSEDEVRIIVNKCNAIVAEIGEPIQRETNTSATIKK